MDEPPADHAANLEAMGFSKLCVRAAWAHAGGGGFEAALQWLFDSAGDADEADVNDSVVVELQGMGFSKVQADAAVRAVGSNIETALQFLLDGDGGGGEEVVSAEERPLKQQRRSEQPAPAVPAPSAAPTPAHAPAAVAAVAPAAAPAAAPTAAPAAALTSKAVSKQPIAVGTKLRVGSHQPRSLSRLMKELRQLQQLNQGQEGGCRKVRSSCDSR